MPAERHDDDDEGYCSPACRFSVFHSSPAEIFDLGILNIFRHLYFMDHITCLFVV